MNRPRSVEGRGFVEAANDLANQMRVGMAGATGLDATACLTLLAARGLDPNIAALFLPYWEAGILCAFAEQKADRTK